MALALDYDDYNESFEVLLEDGGNVFYGYNSEFGIAKKAVFRKDGKLEWSLATFNGVTRENFVSELDNI